jgi:hypothetical protein
MAPIPLAQAPPKSVGSYSEWKRPEICIAFCLTLAILVSDWSRFLAGAAQLAFFDDDFYYYLQIARSLAHGHGSTFDGIHYTNGYHPLWMLVLWAICLLPQMTWLPVVTLLLCTSALLCFVLGRRSLLRTGCTPLLATLIGAFLGYMTMFVNRGGMEITLTLPLLFLLCSLRLEARLSLDGSRAVLYGLLGAAVILSRLDSILLIGPLFVTELIMIRTKSVGAALRAAGRLGIGLLPVLFYVVLNLWLFGTASPVSGQAKQLEDHPAFSAGVIITLVRYLPTAIRATVLAPAALLIALSLTRLAKTGFRGNDRAYQPLLFSLVAFPVFHLLVLASLSDWPLWNWYLYSWIAGALGACLVLCAVTACDPQPERQLPAWSMAALAGLLLLTLGSYAVQRLHLARHQDGVTFQIYQTATDLTRFASDHPGNYAMGDRAGLPGYLLHQPLLQLEGLVMDRQYLGHIRRQENLLEVLKGYRVRYYVGSSLARAGGCFLAVEPYQGGEQSPKMRATICTPPVATFHNSGGETEVFDLAAKQ